MSEELGSIRVVNVRGDEDHRPEPHETLIMIDRTNKVLGNPHVMKTHSRLERERVIEAYRKDLETDIAVEGPMYQALLAMAKDIVENRTKVAAGCWCAGAACHGDVIAEKVRNMIVTLRANPNLKEEHLPSPPLPKIKP